MWDLAHARGVDLVLAGHDHTYERFAPIGAADERDDARGLRSFVVGTGGKNHYPCTRARPHSEARDDRTFGVLRLTLRPDGYDWAFVPVAGAGFRDAGSGTTRLPVAVARPAREVAPRRRATAPGLGHRRRCHAFPVWSAHGRVIPAGRRPDGYPQPFGPADARDDRLALAWDAPSGLRRVVRRSRALVARPQRSRTAGERCAWSSSPAAR